jgi:repressor of nif and glnA expression
MDEPDAPDVLRMAILQIMAEADRPLSAEEIAAELARRSSASRCMATRESAGTKGTIPRCWQHHR